MAETLSLSELKAQNAAEENIDNTDEVETEPEEIDEAEVENDADANIDAESDGVSGEDTSTESDSEADTEQGEAEPLELWQSEDDDEEKDSGFIPDEGWKKQRLKVKAAKAELREKDAKLDELAAQVEQLKQAKLNPAQAQASNEAPPTLEQYDFDEEKFQNATGEYWQRQIDNKINATAQDAVQRQQQDAANRAREAAVNDHYERAEQLISTGKVKVEDYQAVDSNIRTTLNGIFAGNGDAYADQLIATLSNSGGGSEKVWYYLGKNKTALHQLANAFQQDPSGIQAAMFLGKLQQKATQPIAKRKTKAPKPALKVKGDSTVKVSKHQKAYSNETDLQKRISMKRQAKRNGIDVSNW